MKKRRERGEGEGDEGLGRITFMENKARGMKLFFPFFVLWSHNMALCVRVCITSKHWSFCKTGRQSKGIGAFVFLNRVPVVKVAFMTGERNHGMESTTRKKVSTYEDLVLLFFFPLSFLA